MNFATAILMGLLLAAGTLPAQAQAPLSPEEARTLEYGKEIYKTPNFGEPPAPAAK